ncbi:MAG: T9SS type A sorting domain-containing protein [Calditrichaeota bacterium]|nr:T9SS type A sorting domain-containing protein [Calditrichota bacterium]
MKRKIFSLILVMVLTQAISSFSQQLVILKPAKKGQKSEAIPITKKQYRKLVRQTPSKLPGLSLKATHAGILDTLLHPFPTTVNWGIASGDTQSSYYEPLAACVIRAIGIIGQSWSTNELADGFLLQINKAAYGWNFPDDWWNGDAIYTKDHGLPTLLGEHLWGEYPAPIVDGQRVWTEMIWLGPEPDTHGDGFVVSIVPYGSPDSYMGTTCANDNPADTSDIYRLAKFYQAGRSGHDPQFTVRHYSLTWLVVVEYYENTPPSLEPETYSTVLNANAKDLRCHVTDVDAHDASKAGAQTVTLYYRVNDGVWHTTPCSLVNGTNTDGTWQATLPSGYMNPGDLLTYYFRAVDFAGATSVSHENSFGYFQKYNDILAFYNDDGTSYPSWILSPYYDNLWRDGQGDPYQYDVWVGLTDGPLSHELIDQYQTIVQIDAYSPATMNDDVVGNWMASGAKNLFWSSQEWAGLLIGGWGAFDDTTFADDDWHNQFLGIQYAGGTGHDIATDPFRINPVQNDLISGPLHTFLGDSLALYINTSFELGWTNWSDAITPNNNAVVCFTDSAQSRAMGIHTENSGSKTVFLGFDQLCLDTGALPTYTVTDGYHWTEANVHSIADAALDWFLAPPQSPPDIDVNPSSFSFLLDVGESDSSILTIANVAPANNANLNWSISTITPQIGRAKNQTDKSKNNKLKGAGISHKRNLPHLELGKGDPDPRNGEPIVESKGGPDNFGYTWIDSDEPGGPTFNWIDISGTGTEIYLSDDDFYSVTLPFTFSFYGENKTSLKISSNGYLTFGSDGTDFSNDPIPDSFEPNDIICPFWDDLYPNHGNGAIYYQSDAERFIVQYSNVQKFSGSGSYTFQIILFQSGDIKFQYLHLTGNVTSATIGIENSNGSDGLEVVFNASYVHDLLAVKISKGVQWLDISPLSGSVPAQQSEDVRVKVNAADLNAGNYQARLVISSNDPDEPLVQIPVSLEVRGQCQPPYLKAADVSALEGEISVAIYLEQNPQPVDAFGFQFSFDSTKLSFNRLEKGSLTQNFSYFQSYENSGGLITVGGFDNVAIPANSSGSVAKIVLDVNPSPCNEGERSVLQLSDLVDDFVGLNICNGIFKCEPNCQLGDVNWDGDLTPGDALCAFNIFLSDGVPPSECDNPCALKAADTNCSPNGVTPGDALYIFLGYLNGAELPLPCDPNFQVASNQATDRARLRFERIEGNENGEITFALHLENCDKIQAFGMAIGYPDNLLQFREATPGPVTEAWQAIEGKESVAGVIYLGGFQDQAQSIEGKNAIAYLKFKARPGAEGSGELWIYNLSDDLVNAEAEKFNFATLHSGIKVIANGEIPDEYQLHQNYPNPFNLNTEIVYELPEPTQVTLELFNTTGQKIRTLISQRHPAGRFSVQWDGKDEAGNVVSSGVYLYRLKTPRFSAMNKLILVK